MFYRTSELQALAQSVSRRMQKSVDSLTREAAYFSEGKQYDVFISHSFADAEIILGVAEILKQSGKSVYVDWIEDGSLDRKNVTQATAQILRHRMRSSSSLLYVHTKNSTLSKWMPWELGFFDGFRPDAISIFPVVIQADAEWQGQEYLSLYPVVEKLAKDSQYRPFVVRANRKAQPIQYFGSSTLADYYTKYSDSVI